MSISPRDWTGSELAGGRYLVVAKLGEGGMGAVYRAHDRNIDADVVIKAPLPSMLEDPEFARRFKDEIRSLVRLSHPHIVKVTDVGESNGLPFAVMQFLPGGSLEDRQSSGAKNGAAAADPKDVLRWLAGIASALDYVHSQGYVHRDVKPGNILFDAQGHPFLGDFGVVKVLASSADAKSSRTSMTGAGMVIGTPEYMAPELIMGESFDGRVDQYALAVTVYELLCGQRPFEDETKTKVLVLHTTRAPSPPSERCPWIPARLSEAVLKGLAKDPNQRYPNCLALSAAVSAAIEAVAASPPERVRIKCPSCGKSLAVAAADFARFQQSGRRVACPSCKAPVPVSVGGGTAGGADTSALSATGSGTMLLTAPTASGEFAVAEGQGSGPARRTVALSSPMQTSENAPLESQPLPESTRKGANRTVVERAQPAIPDASVAEVRPKRSRRKSKSGRPAEATAVQGERARIALVAVGTVVVIGVVTLVREIRWSPVPSAARPIPIPVDMQTAASGQNRIPLPPKPAAPKLMVPASPPREALAKAEASSPAVAPQATKPAAATSPPAVSVGSTVPTSGTSRIGTVASSNEPPAESGPMPVSVATTQPVNSPPLGSNVATSTTPPAKDDPDAADLLAGDAVTAKGSVSLEHLITHADAYANQTVMANGAYCLGDAIVAGNDGIESLGVIQGMLHLEPNGSRVVKRAKAFTVEIDPGLAEQLSRGYRLGRTVGSSSGVPNWGNDVAILTLKVLKSAGAEGDHWTCRIVKLEFFANFDLAVVAVGYKKKLRIRYKTLVVTPAAVQAREGNPDDWGKLDRLGHITNQFQKIFDKQSYQLSQAKWVQFNNQLNSVMMQQMQNAARNQAAFDAQRRSMLPPQVR